MVSSPIADWNLIGHECDALAIGLEPLGTSFIASQYSSWLRLRAQSVGGNIPIWATIQTEFSPVLAEQVTLIASQLPPTPIEPQQLKFLCYEALAGGSRGLRFASKNSLDNPDPATRLRATTLKWMINPFEAVGAVGSRRRSDGRTAHQGPPP